MKITVKRTGGFAGLTTSWSIVVDDQPDSDRVKSLVESLPRVHARRNAASADRFVYLITFARRRVTLPEPQLTGPWLELVEMVRDRSSSP